jgi:hypothetical protein|uniref:Uncharacterized protein n=1 Tax=Siphoviridae sp. ctbvd11 TaxID=2825567 RepID=A0A8S5QD13_9CAUD|nr:MAG TPA: hypothetical protein [Siphoviridae sp. ctbvd11]DAG34542.1 MAG TPA: hypothetical protein [Caudoviricetes sp.]
MMKINKETIQKLNPLFQAIAEGKTIQVESGDDWMDIDFGGEGVNASTLITCPECYRIKPEAKYRSFKNAEECWQEMSKHQPFGWIKCKEGYFNIVYVDDDYAGLADPDGSSILLASKNSYQDNTFYDGTPFGMKVEE